MAKFKLKRDSAQLKFYQSRNQIQIMGGGFGNGKTALLCMKVLDVATDYPGCRIVFGRSTKPKLEDTVKPEFFKWCPPDWIAKMPTDKHNDCILTNGSTVHFRHLKQEGRGKGENASNLLSATYDAAAIDQVDDPLITHKDFLDIMGRLRGTTPYKGSDASMPLNGPQWLLVSCNPTRNWVYREVVNPFHVFKKTGIVTEKLVWDKENKKCLIDLFEAPTKSNVHNTGENYVRLLEAAYKGSMKKRYLDGEWGAYEGLVYPEFDQTVHMLEASTLNDYIKGVIQSGEFAAVEGYDHGIIVPSCYMLGIIDKWENMYIIDGIYTVGDGIDEMSDNIRAIRRKWGIAVVDPIYADPSLFKKSNVSKETVGESVSELYAQAGIQMRRGNNNITSGVAKIASHLHVHKAHFNPVQMKFGSPHLFISSDLEWFNNEISDYMWNTNISGENVDKPRDTKDHAMDTLKYMHTHRPTIGRPVGQVRKEIPNDLRVWREIEERRDPKAHRLLM